MKSYDTLHGATNSGTVVIPFLKCGSTIRPRREAILVHFGNITHVIQVIVIESGKGRIIITMLMCDLFRYDAFAITF